MLLGDYEPQMVSRITVAQTAKTFVAHCEVHYEILRSVCPRLAELISL